MTENRKIPSLSHVYSGRSVIPAKFKDLRICVINTDKRIQTIPKGTPLGIVERAEVLESVETTSASGTENQTPKDDVLKLMMDSLPDELTEEQRSEVQQLLQEYENIFSRNEYDIGRTPLVEYQIDTGENRPIRQPLRRHPFKHLDRIEEQVEEMRRHGIIEPAASPWASNVVLSLIHI